MLQESLLNLRQRVEALFRDKGYKEACIKRYNHTWDHLRVFMSKKGVTLYTRELGESFLVARYGKKSFEGLTHRQQECVRHIEVLTQMLETGTVHRSRVTPKKIVFTGPEGALFNQFLSAETEYKRSSSVQRYEERLYNLYTFLCAFPGDDPREFWQRAEERTSNTARLYDELGMAEYQAMEVFVKLQ